MLGKTQYEVENEYAFIDLPELMKLANEKRAAELMEQLEVTAYPHIADKAAQKAIINRIRGRLPQAPAVPAKSAEEQYEAQLARMRGGI
ncbi:hypothetical protein [Paenibacillus koleovorans]|uniref:hypothetical protein n=1 Tax=Paenibacillus koleovorans TaxID=121608 RepID=UPI000FD736C0|nr:hypothetical protein [Paenibacillus koleovorans]